MRFFLDIHSHSHNDSRLDTIDSVQTLLNNELRLPLRFHVEIVIDTHLQRDFTIDTIQPILEREFASQLKTHLLGRPSYFSSRDRDICADPLLVGGP